MANSILTAPPDVDWASLEDDFARRCIWCHDKLHPLIETLQGTVWVCTNMTWHGSTAVYVPNQETPIHLEGAKWIIDALVEERGIPRRTA